MLQNWMKPPSPDSRGCIPEAKEALGHIITEAPGNYIKEMFLKIKSDTAFEANNKTIFGFDIKILQDCYKYLGGMSDGLIKEGLSYRILHRLYALMPHNCEACIISNKLHNVT